MGLQQLVQVQVCHRPRTSPPAADRDMSSSSHSQSAGIVYDSEVYSSMLAAAFGQLRVSEEEVQGSTSQSSTGIMMSDTFAAVLNSSPQASPLPSPFPVNDQWESRSRPDLEADPKDVPVPESGSEQGEWEDWPVQEEPE
eukprot:6459843-Amphidinium_carterae.1